MTKVQCAFAAGLIEGEGSIGIYRYLNPKCSRAQYSLVLTIGMTTASPVLFMHQHFGGFLTTPRRKSPDRRICYFWKVTGKKAGLALKRIRPYLLDKGSQADLAIEYAATCGNGGGRTSATVQKRRERMVRLIAKMKRENTRTDARVLQARNNKKGRVPTRGT